MSEWNPWWNNRSGSKTNNKCPPVCVLFTSEWFFQVFASSRGICRVMRFHDAFNGDGETRNFSLVETIEIEEGGSMGRCNFVSQKNINYFLDYIFDSIWKSSVYRCIHDFTISRWILYFVRKQFQRMKFQVSVLSNELNAKCAWKKEALWWDV